MPSVKKKAGQTLDNPARVFYYRHDRRTYVSGLEEEMLSAAVIGVSLALSGVYLGWQWWSRELAEGE